VSSCAKKERKKIKTFFFLRSHFSKVTVLKTNMEYRAFESTVGPQAARLLTWLTVSQDEIAKGDKWPSWALTDFVRGYERNEDRTYLFFTFLVSNGIAPERAAEWMHIADYRNGILHYGPLQDKREYQVRRLVRRANDGTLYKTAPRMMDLANGRPSRPGNPNE